jgi:hypothetical protein
MMMMLALFLGWMKSIVETSRDWTVHLGGQNWSEQRGIVGV